MPASHLKKPNSKLFMRHDQSGTEVRVLENPHLPHSHYLGLKRQWSHNHRRIIQMVLDGLPPELSNIVPLFYHKLLCEDKYAPGEGSKWKHVSARFPDLYKALLAEPDEAVPSSIFRTAVHLAG